jgi:hypothetical protein
MGVPYSIFCCFKSTTNARLIDLEAGGGGSGTYSTDVNSMLASADNTGIRTSIGLGTASSPTFLKVIAYDATNSVGSLNGFQLGSPTYTGKHGLFSRYSSSSEGWTLMSGGATQISGTVNWPGPWVTQHIGFSPTSGGIPTSFLWEDAPGVLGLRNGSSRQSFRVYNTYTSATVFERAVMGWNATTGNLDIGTEFLGGSGMAAKQIDFVTGGAVRMSIAAAGNVGIGTTTPASGLHIAGALGTNTTTYDSAAALKLTNTSGGSWLVTSGIIGVANAHFSIRQESVAQPAIVVTGPGNNVGIGINAPAAKLDILDTTLSGSGSLAGSALNIAQTWNTTGNPSLIYGRVVNTNSGGSSNLIDLGTFAGGSLFRVDKTGAITCASVSGTSLAVTTGFFAGSVRANTDAGFLSIGSTNDVVLTRDAAGILAQRNGTNAQAFRVYNTDPVGGAKEWGGLAWSGNEFRVESAATGGGSIKRTILGGSDIVFVASSGARWQITSTALLAFADNAYDIGASGANRPRDVYAGGNGIFGGVVSAAFGFRAPSSSQIIASSDGIWRLTNSSVNDFNRLQFGSTTDAFPAIARDGAGIKFTGAAAGSTSWIKVPAVAVSALPSAATAGAGARAFVNDALAPVFGSAVASGGTVNVPVYSNGTNWFVG